MSDLVGNPKDRFSHDATHIIFGSLHVQTKRICAKGADGTANSVDPDQTSPQEE